MGLPPLRGPGGNCRYVSARRTETGSAGTMFRATRTFWRRGTCGPGVPGPGTEGRSALPCGLPAAVAAEAFPMQPFINARETMVTEAPAGLLRTARVRLARLGGFTNTKCGGSADVG